MGTKQKNFFSKVAPISYRYYRTVWSSMCLASLLTISLPSSAFELTHGGRLSQANGEPIVGPVDLTFRFYRLATGGSALVTVPVPNVSLVDGVFNAPIPLSNDEIQRLFEDGDRDLFLEIESQGKVYPRQKFSYVPFALRVPVDGSKIVYDDDGKLTLGPGAPTGFTGLPGVSGSGGVESLGNQSYSTYTLSQAGKSLVAASTPEAQRSLLGLGSMAIRNSISFTDLPVAPCSDGNVLRLSGGSWTCISLDLDGKLGGKPLSLGTPGAESTGKVIKWDGTQFTLAADEEGEPGGGITSVSGITSTTQFLTVETTGVSSGTVPTWTHDSPSATHKLTLPMASVTGVSAGLISKAQFDVFSAKQDTISAASVVDTGTVTTSLQNGLEIRPFSTETGNTGELRFRELDPSGTNFVGFKAPSAIPSSTIWTLPPGDGNGGYVLSTDGSGSLSWISPTTGSVTTIATGTGLTGGPISGSGTISIANVGSAGTYTKVTTNAQGQVVAGSTLSDSDIPSLSAAKITSGTLPVALGGTGAVSFTNNGVLVGSGTSPLSATVAGTQYQVLRADAGGAPAFGAVSLDQSAAVTGRLPIGNGGTGGGTAAEARTNLGLGSAATLNVGTSPDNLVQLGTGSKLPAVDGTQLTGVVKSAGDSMTGALNLPSNGLTVGTNELVVAEGNVGIGTSAPAFQFDVAATTGSQVVAVRTSSATDSAIFRSTNGDRAWNAGTRGDLSDSYAISDSTAGQHRFVIDTSGNVGIGTTNPNQNLAVIGVGYVSANFGVGAVADENVGRLRVFGNTTIPTIRADQVGPGPVATFIGGNVGIGTTTPQASLHVEKSAYTSSAFVFNNGVTGVPPAYPNLSFNNIPITPSLVVRASKTTGSRPLFFGIDNGDGTGWSSAFSIGACGTFSQLCLDLSDGTNLTTALQNSGTTLKVGGGADGNYTNVEFSNTGNVGIGTTNPTAKLQVNGQFVTSLPSTMTPTGTTQTIDWSTGNLQTLNLASATGNVTLTFANGVPGAALGIKIIQGSTPRNIVWPASVKWPGGLAPTISTGNGAMDLVTLFFDGTFYLAAAGQNYQ